MANQDQPLSTRRGLSGDHAVELVDKVVTEAGYRTDGIALLRPPADNAMVAISPIGLVARVGVDIAFRERLANEARVARWLKARGMPAVQPAEMPGLSQLDIIDGRVFTWWTYLPQDGSATVRDLGRALRRLHEQGPRWPHLPTLDPWARVASQLETATLPDGDANELQRHWRRLTLRWQRSGWSHRAASVIHGDAHRGNILISQGVGYLLDFEDTRLGPPEWDLAYVIASARVGWLSASEIDAFWHEYGPMPDHDADFELLVDIAQFRRTCWLASRLPFEPKLLDQVRHRIATIVDPGLPRYWLPV
ncbi:phosphotransferase enzyme family protein [Salinispora mooreana]|uniref:phosphotransferase enzyme family protein n=1 Tax=Salinispora mooreana TaxID=999545 RepID=UPI0009B756DD|nr:aminoglycoside phosphotransferase family protein [Salinispora mooreana]